MKPDTILSLALQGKPLTDTLIIDFHAHLGQWAIPHSPAHDEKMLAAMDRVGITMICVNGALYPDMRTGNDRVAAFARRFPERVVPFAFLNLYQCVLLDELRRCVEELGMRGLKVHHIVQGVHSPGPAHSDHAWDAVWKYCGRNKLPVLAHGIVGDEDIRRNPETIFVGAHHIIALDRVERLRDCPNFYADTASTQNKTWSLPALIRLVSSDRILWGTDAPMDDFAQRLGIVLDSCLSEADQRKILGGNAARILRLNS